MTADINLIKIWSDALSDTEIQIATQPNVAPTSLIGTWDFADDQTKDITGKNPTAGQLTGGATVVSTKPPS